MNRVARGNAFFLFLLLGACSANSLVGNPDLPSDAVLSRERISIRFGARDIAHDATDILSIDILPDNSFHTRRSRMIYHRLEELRYNDIRAQHGALSPERAMTIRRMLARLQPAQLSRDWTLSRIEGCGIVSDGQPDFVVDFAGEAKKGGLFSLYAGCDVPDARPARKLVDDVRALVPGSLAAGPILY